MRLVPTTHIPMDAILSDPLYTADGRMLVREGVQLTPALVDKINQNHIFSVYIKDRHSTGEIEHLVDPMLKLKGYNLVKNIFDAASYKKPDGTPAPKSIFEMMPELTRLMEDILYEMIGFREKQLEYIDIKNVNSYLYSSAINVALLSVLIGWELGLNAEMINHLFMGGIFHDIGLAMLPKEVLYKKEPLTMDEKRLILFHPLKGYEYLRDKSFLSSYIRVITLGHHEHIDGSGYPNRKSGEEVSQLAQIVGIADIYDAMTSDRPYHRALPVSEALEYIMSVADKHFDMAIVKAFIKKINPYPAGSLVKLVNGQIAVVRKVPANMPLRPLISIIKERDGEFEYEDVDLMDNRTLTIKGIHY